MRIQQIILLFRPYLQKIVVVIVSSVFLSVITAVTPIISSQMIDQGLIRQDLQKVTAFAVVLILLQILDRILQYIQTRQEILISNAFGKDLKIKALRHGFRLKPDYIREYGFFETVSNALYDIGNIVSITSNNFLLILIILCKTIGAAIGLYILNWKLALFVSSLIPIKILINNYIRKQAEKYNQNLMNANKNYNAWFSGLLSGIIDIKLWNLEKQKTEESKEQIEKINKASEELSVLNARNSMVTNIVEAGYLNLLYVIGCILIEGSSLTLGTLFSVISFASYLLVPVNTIMDLRILLKQITPNIESLKRYFFLEEENYSTGLLPEKKIEKITFDHISLNIGGNQILKNISFEVKKGAKVAFIGENGSGKSTLLKLLLRLCEPSEGKILFNETDILQYNIEAYRKKFSVVTQDVHLFDGTVKDNIRFENQGSKSTEDRSIVHGFDPTIEFLENTILNLEKGYETPVGEDGVKVSGGEKQKIALARALNRRTEILVLDEASSNYDQESVELLAEFLKKDSDYDYYFIVSHQKELVQNADMKVYLENGEIAKIEL